MLQEPHIQVWVYAIVTQKTSKSKNDRFYLFCVQLYFSRYEGIPRFSYGVHIIYVHINKLFFAETNMNLVYEESV